MSSESHTTTTTTELTKASGKKTSPGIELDRRKLLGFDQGKETSVAGEFGPGLAAKIGGKAGTKGDANRS